jgi:predicted ATPase
MKDFKLIAIRPLTGCNKKFTKILSEGTPYVFYNDYDFSKYTDQTRIIKQKENATPNLYSVKNKFKKDININISAIVGENGSGKSSIVELFYVACYNLSVINNVLFDEEEEIQLSSKDIVPEIKVELFYTIDNELFLLKLDNTDVESYNLKNSSFSLGKTKFNLNDFFYTISINYSLHSLNSNILGDWVRKIFHKNDGYQTPIVLNPYRNKGNIEINNEEYLVKSRMISNILGKVNNKSKTSESLRNILDKKVAHKLKIELNKEKFIYDEKTQKPIFKNTEKFGNTILPVIYKYFLKDGQFTPKETLLNKYAKEYILYKIGTIAGKYQPYKRLFRSFEELASNDLNNAEAYIQMLAEDKSHVTFKLRQAINFLSNELYFNRKESFELTVAYLSNQLDKESKSKDKELIDILPPAFFKIDIEFQDSDLFNLLSSGEKQRIYSISTLIYHLNNLSSVATLHQLYKYKRVHIIFDELELYFHPELQRNLINDIVESIKKIDLKEIDSINILLITHSPFILSDIPDANILFLEDNGLPIINRENIKTFGGNIHELLAHSFFLNKGFIGEFARNRIQTIIDKLNPDEKKSKKDLNKDLIWKEIQIIGEPFLKEKLEEMYYSKFDKTKRINELRAELNRLEND